MVTIERKIIFDGKEADLLVEFMEMAYKVMGQKKGGYKSIVEFCERNEIDCDDYSRLGFNPCFSGIGF